MKYNLIAATGKLGRKIVKNLLDLNVSAEDIIITARKPQEEKGFISRGIEVRKGDYDDPESLKKAFEGCNRLLMIPSLAKDEQRILQTHNALSAAIHAKIDHVYFSSFISTSMDSYFKAIPFYLYAEKKIQLSGLRWTILRNGVYLDPLAEWIPQLLPGGILKYPVEKGKGCDRNIMLFL